MNRSRITSLLSVLTLVFAGVQLAPAGTVSPVLEKRLAAADGAPVRALVVLGDQVDIRSLDADLQASRAPLALRHETVIRALQDKAAATQSGLISDLEAGMAGGDVLHYRSHWLINAVKVEAQADVLTALASRPEVDRIEPVFKADSGVEPAVAFEPVAEDKSLSRAASGPRALRAPEVWHDLGITGAGQIVGVLDSGVDGAHYALASNWRGNSAPAWEAWLQLVDEGSPDFPVDGYYTGTIMAGLMVGHAPGDTMGVAPGAEWIASNFLNQYVGDKFDADYITSLEWMTDPDGNPATVDDMPASAVNAWGVFDPDFSRYTDCENRWWAAMDAAEAAGLVLIYMAGTERLSYGSIWSPADYAATETSGFSVGNTHSYPPFDVHRDSARGPSGCGGPWATKPEVVAPGENVKAPYPGDQIAYYTSSGASAAFVAGVVALMREANPDADAETIKQALLNSAIDMGAVGDDNDSGRGFVDAYAAVSAILADLGVARGTVTDQVTGLPVESAVVRDVNSSLTMVTDINGEWSHPLAAGSYTFQVTRRDYFTETVAFTKTDGVEAVVDAALAPRPFYQLSGTVTGPDALPVAGAMVRSHLDPAVTAQADSNGFYSVSLPGGADLVHDLVVWGDQAGLAQAGLALTGPLVQDFVLAAKLGDGFESGDFSRYQWWSTGNDPWVVDRSHSRTGLFGAHSGDSQSPIPSSLHLDFWAAEAGTLTFDFQLENQAGQEYLHFIMDDDVIGSWTGDLPWTTVSFHVPQGHHVFEWRHDTNLHYSDPARAWLDNVVLPATGIEPLAVLELDTTDLPVDVVEFQTATSTFHVTNGGHHPLDVVFQTEPVAKATGGPDAWGYVWRDSDDPAGPVYDWVDATAGGWATGLGNEDMALEVDLGFPFLFYGVLYDEVNISSNGFLSFVSDVPAYFNRALPYPTNPNGLIAPFWDDLNPGTGAGEVWWKQEPENGRFIVSWEAVNRDGTSVPETFQVILYADGRIVFQYAVVNNPSSCSVGIENHDGSIGNQVAWNDTGYLRAGLAVEFDPVPLVDWITCTPWYARVLPGQTLPVEVLVDASELEGGVHVAGIRVFSNDRASGEPTVTVTASVTGVSGVSGETPRALTFAGAVPNPFNPMTRLRFELPHRAEVRLEVYDLAGRRIRDLYAGVMEAGTREIAWNGRDDRGRGVASGRYFARLSVEGLTLVRSMTLVR